VQQEIARHLKDEITKKEDSGDESILLACERQLFVHRHGGEANVHTIDVIDHELDEKERDGAHPNFVRRSLLEVKRSNCRAGRHTHLPR
jgi:hypothetical protein